jgi:hypothetical protein
MIAFRTSPPAPSKIECNVFGEGRTLASTVTRFTAEASSVDAMGLNLPHICRPNKKKRKIVEMNEPNFRKGRRG